MNEQDIMKNFGRSIMCLRDDMDMSMREFADYVGVSKSAINEYENGHHMPQLYTAVLIAQKLGITLDDLVGMRPHE